MTVTMYIIRKETPTTSGSISLENESGLVLNKVGARSEIFQPCSCLTTNSRLPVPTPYSSCQRGVDRISDACASVHRPCASAPKKCEGSLPLGKSASS